MVTTVKGQIVRMEADDFRTMGRATQGVRLIDLRGKDKVAGVSVVHELPEEFRGSDEEQKESGEFLGKAAGIALFLMFIILVTQLTRSTRLF